MARQQIPVVTPPSLTAGGISANAADITFTAADATNKEYISHTGREILIAFNSGATGRTVTITSVADELGRTGDITTYALAAGEYAVFGPFPVRGWRQSNGQLYFEASHAEVKWAAIKVPESFVP